jgi:hypothetical protein
MPDRESDGQTGSGNHSVTWSSFTWFADSVLAPFDLGAEADLTEYLTNYTIQPPAFYTDPNSDVAALRRDFAAWHERFREALERVVPELPKNEQDAFRESVQQWSESNQSAFRLFANNCSAITGGGPWQWRNWTTTRGWCSTENRLPGRVAGAGCTGDSHRGAL